jgi:hypothetical protein
LARAAGKTQRIGPAEVIARHGVAPKQVPDFIRCAANHRTSAKGTGQVGAAWLIRKCGLLDALLAEGKLQAQADALRLHRSIATIDSRAPVPAARDQKPTWMKAAELLRFCELQALAERLEKMAH